MPLVNSQYHPPFYLFNGHLQTIIPSVFYSGDRNPYARQRIDTSDEDFLDLDWIKKGNKKLALITHGLEGCSTSTYMLRMALDMSNKGYDILSWNFRSCSGELNRKKTFYHSGFTNDLHEVLQYVIASEEYNEIVLISFSIGGNITLKYLGEQGVNVNSIISSAIVFSAPVDLESGAVQLAKPSRRIYMDRFLKSFRDKFTTKEKLHPGTFDLNQFEHIKNFFQFDQIFTAPMFGFRDVYDYYARASSRPYIPDIKIPTLIVNALNDPFLGSNCFPTEETIINPNVFLETPKNGGHVGFPVSGKKNWASERVMEFVELNL